LNKYKLEKLGLKCKYLELFSNISMVKGDTTKMYNVEMNLKREIPKIDEY